MAPRRPNSNTSRARRSPNSSGRGVQKRKKTIKDDGLLGPGRKRTWSLPWLKRLVVLRFCGLHFNEIFEILSILSGNSTPRVERTAQHNMRQLFGSGWKELCAPNKSTQIRRLKWILATEKLRKARQGADKSGSRNRSYRKPKTPSPTPINTQSLSRPLSGNAEGNAEISSQHTKQYTTFDKPLPQLPCSVSLDNMGTKIRTEYQTTSYSFMSPYGGSPLLIPTPVQTQNSITYSEPFANPFVQEFISNLSYPMFASEFTDAFAPFPMSNLANPFDTPDNWEHMSQDTTEMAKGYFPDCNTLDMMDTEPLVSLPDAQSMGNGDTTISTQYSLLSERDLNQAMPHRPLSQSSKMSKMSEILKRLGRPRSERSLIKRAMSLRYSLSSFNTSIRQSSSSISIDFEEDARVSIPDNWEMRDNQETPAISPTTLMLREFGDTIISDNQKLFQTCCSQDPDILQGCIHKQINRCVVNPRARLKPPVGRDHVSVDGSGRNALFFAASVGAPLRVLSELIYAYRSTINTLDSKRRTFLFYLDPQGLLTSEQFSDLMRNLFFRGFNFTQYDYQGKSFLDWLCLSSSFQMEWLWDLMWSDSYLRQTIEELCTPRNFDWISFPDRLSVQNYETFREFHFLELSGGHGRTQIHHLMARKCDNSNNKDADLLDLVQSLYKDGANMNLQSRCGTTPLILAAILCLPKTVTFLLSIGADVRAKDYKNFSAWEYALHNFNSARSLTTPAGPLAESLLSLAQFADHKLGPSPTNTTSSNSTKSLRFWPRSFGRSKKKQEAHEVLKDVSRAYDPIGDYSSSLETLQESREGELG